VKWKFWLRGNNTPRAKTGGREVKTPNSDGGATTVNTEQFSQGVYIRRWDFDEGFCLVSCGYSMRNIQ
jgi:hypothetical protein